MESSAEPEVELAPREVPVEEDQVDDSLAAAPGELAVPVELVALEVAGYQEEEPAGEGP